ncbi:MAG TPA: family 16 glycoside hydrolase [Bryobacteraceae bacterium]|nr:family 16 glycoside hydrolase [Bryobacteraceae bacterium]
MATTPTSQVTDFSRDVFGRFVCNGMDEALRSTDQNARPDARPFGVIMIGGGTFGSALAQHIFSQDQFQSHRILVLEGGPFLLTEHVQNLPNLGLNPPPPSSIADLRAIGQDRTARNEVWGLPWHSRDAKFPGLAYCLAGRSLFWGGWSPRPLDTELLTVPAATKQDLQNRYYDEAAQQTGSSVTNDFIFGPLHEAMRAQLAAGIGAGRVTDAIAFSQLPVTAKLRKGAVRVMAAGAGSSGGTSVSQDELKLEAPLAVQSRNEDAGTFPVCKFSAMPLVMKAARQAYFESAGDDVRKRLMVVPNCHVKRLITSGGRVTGVDTNLGFVPLAPNGVVVVALGTIESTRLALLSFGGISNYDLIGRNLLAHLRSNLNIRIPRESLAQLNSAITDLQTSALFVKGRHTHADGTSGHFHLQITASGLGKTGADAEAELFQKIPDIDGIDVLNSATDTHVVVAIRGIGEMEQRQSARGVALDPEPDEFGVQRAIVTITPTQKDLALWDAMDKAADQVAQIFAGGRPFDVLFKNRDDLGTTHHEAGTLWMGDDPATSVTNSDCRFHQIENAYVAGPALMPSTGSPNPMLSGIALVRRLGDQLVQPFAPEAGFKALFDGLSTANWNMAGPGNFLAMDGALESVPGGDIGLFWCTTPTPPDFVLRLEWMRTGPNDNSGVFVRFPDPNSKGYNNTAFVGVNFGFEVQIDEQGVPDGAGIHKTGAIYAQPSQTLSQIPAKPPLEWNQYEIRVKGQTYTVQLNGVQVTTFQNTDGARGLPSTNNAPSFIGLQSHTGRVAFRKIRIKAI